MKNVSVETTTTETHIYVIQTGYYGEGVFEAIFQPLNPKTGKPWQASHRIIRGATIEPQGWKGRPILYASLEAARTAVEWKKATIK